MFRKIVPNTEGCRIDATSRTSVSVVGKDLVFVGKIGHVMERCFQSKNRVEC